MKRELRLLPARNIDVDAIAPAATATGGIYLVVFLVTLVFGEPRLIAMPDGPRAILNTGAALVFGGAAWIILVAALSAAGRASDARPGWVNDFHSTTCLTGGTRWIVVVLGIGLVPAAQVAADGGLNGFLWLAAASAWLGFALAAFGVRRRRRPVPAPAPVEEPPAAPALDDWFDRFREATGGKGRQIGSFAGSGSAAGDGLGDLGPLQVALRSLDVPKPLAEAYRLIRQRLDGGPRTLALDMPRGGGLLPIISALSYESVGREHGRVLLLCPDRQAAAVVHRGLERRLSSDALWSNTTTIGLVGGANGIIAGEVIGLESIPHVAVMTPSDLDVVLRQGSTTSWGDYFRVLRLVVVFDADAYVGVSGSHMSTLLRRLEVLCRRLRVAPRYLLECPGGPDRRVFLSQLSGLDIDPESMIHATDLNARTVDVWDWPVSADDATPIGDGCAALVAAITEGRYGCLVLAGPDASNSDVEAIRQRISSQLASDGVSAAGRWDVAREPEGLEPPIAGCDLAVVVGFTPSWARIKHDYGMLGSAMTDTGPARLTLIPVDAVATAFLGSSVIGGRDAELSFEPENRSVMDLHLRAAVGSDVWLESELRAIGNVGPTLTAWREGGLVPASDAIDPLVRPARESAAYFRPKLHFDSSEEATVPVHVAGARREPLLVLDASRALRVAYPRSLILVDGERFQVQSVEHPADGALAITVQNSSVIEMVTRPMFRVEIEPAPTVGNGHQTVQGALRLDRRRVFAREELVGFVRRRILGGRGVPARTVFEQSMPGTRYETEGLSLGVVDGQVSLTMPAMHAAAHVLRTAAHLSVEFEDPGLGMTVIERCPWMSDAPAIVVYDRAGGGLGIVQTIGSLLEGILERACVLVSSCDCGPGGCGDCIDNPSCSLGLSVGEMDKQGATTILCAIAGVTTDA